MSARDLPVPRRQDLVAQRGGRLLPVEGAQAAHPRLLEVAPELAWRQRALSGLVGGAEHPGVVHRVAGAPVAPAQRVERGDEHLGGEWVGRHVGSGAGDRRAPRAAGEAAGGGGHVGGRDPRSAGHVVEGERLDRGAQLLEPRRVRGDEVAVVQLLVEDQPHHPRQQRRILAWLHRQVHRRVVGGLRAPRVDHDDVEPPLHVLPEVRERVRAGELHALDQERLERVGADEQDDVGVLDAVEASLPVAVQRAGDALRRLVDGDGGVEGRRADALEPAQAERERHVRPRLRAVVERDRPGSVLGDDRLQLRRHLVHRLLARELVETTVGSAPQRRAEHARVVVLRRELPSLLAREALRDRMVRVAVNREHAVVLDLDLDAAVRVAEAADRRVRGPGHPPPPPTSPVGDRPSTFRWDVVYMIHHRGARGR